MENMESKAIVVISCIAQIFKSRGIFRHLKAASNRLKLIFMYICSISTPRFHIPIFRATSRPPAGYFTNADKGERMDWKSVIPRQKLEQDLSKMYFLRNLRAKFLPCYNWWTGCWLTCRKVSVLKKCQKSRKKKHLENNLFNILY